MLKWMDGAWHSSPRDKHSWLVSVSSAEGCHTRCTVLSRAWAETEQVYTTFAANELGLVTQEEDRTQKSVTRFRSERERESSPGNRGIGE